MEWFDNASLEDLLNWPCDDQKVVGGFRVSVSWEGSGDDAELTLVKPKEEEK